MDGVWRNHVIKFFKKFVFFCKKCFFSHRQYISNELKLFGGSNAKQLFDPPTQKFKLLISLYVRTEIKFRQKIRNQHETTRQMICDDHMVIFLAQKFRTKFVFHAYTIIYLSRNFDISKIILQLSYIIRSGILC